MRKISPVIPLLLVVLVAVSVFAFVQNRRDADSMRALQKSEETTRARYDQAVNDIAAIQDSLNAITLTGGEGGMQSSPLSAERRLSPTHGDEALARVAELRAGIQRARDRIAQLETRLHASGIHVAALEGMVVRLKRGLAEKEQLVADLSGRVDSLQTHVNGLTASIQENETRIASQEVTLEDRRRELGTVYYVIGTRKELMKSGAVVARGGVLGLGKTLDPSGQLAESTLTPVDTDQQTVIPIAATRARVLTAQPAASYALEPANGQLELRILDTREFRKVRHLVILTG